MWKRGNSCTLLRMQIVSCTVENSMEIPQKVKTELAYDLAIPLLDTYPKKIKTLIWKKKKTYTPGFIAPHYLQ